MTLKAEKRARRAAEAAKETQPQSHAAPKATAAGVVCFMLEPTEKQRVWLRRYVSNDEKCAASGYHNALALIGDFDAELPEPTHNDPRWPTRCACGLEFGDDVTRQVFSRKIYRKSDNGELTTIDEAGPGAMYSADSLEEYAEWRGPDGRSLHVVLPNGRTWCIDSRASNCDSPCARCGVPYKDHQRSTGCSYEDGRPHKCWIRQGTPPLLTVGKNGVTCGAGAGSILAGDYHGFLRNGRFEP